jgi:hypothetical protein
MHPSALWREGGRERREVRERNGFIGDQKEERRKEGERETEMGR